MFLCDHPDLPFRSRRQSHAIILIALCDHLMRVVSASRKSLAICRFLLLVALRLVCHFLLLSALRLICDFLFASRTPFSLSLLIASCTPFGRTLGIATCTPFWCRSNSETFCSPACQRTCWTLLTWRRNSQDNISQSGLLEDMLDVVDMEKRLTHHEEQVGGFDLIYQVCVLCVQ